MTGIKPLAVGPFEMLYHAETHSLKGEDFDRRIALISYYTSEILYNVDYQAYKEIGEELLSFRGPDAENTEAN